MEKIDFQKLLPGVQENIPLKNYTTFKIGGPAQYFFKAKTKKDLIKAVSTAKKFKLPFFILAGGSNLLVSDKGFKGLIIKLQVSDYNFQENKVFTEAGVLLSQLLSIALRNNLTGLEWAAGIPGTIGGAVRGNAGTKDQTIKEVIENVEVLDTKKGKIKFFKNKDCRFEYRDSIFKHEKNLIILSINFKLKNGKKEKIKEKIKEYLNYRKDTQPLDFPSAGSIFKNPQDFSAGELIEKCGLKGKRIKDVEISKKHANFIINLENGTARDVIELIKITKEKVKEKFEITLKEEIQYLGF